MQGLDKQLEIYPGTKFNCISSMPGLTVIKLSSFGDLKQPRYWSYVGDPMSSQS